MAAKRARGALYVTQDEKKCFGWPPIAPALEKRIHEALATPGRPGVRKIAARFAVNPGRVAGFDRDCLLTQIMRLHRPAGAP
jgi:hypothetical protein